KLVLRGGYGLYYSRNFYNGQGPNPGYAALTPWTSSVNGITVTTPLAQTFQSGLVPITGNTLGGLTNIGQSAGSGNGDTNPNRSEKPTTTHCRQNSPIVLAEACCFRPPTPSRNSSPT